MVIEQIQNHGDLRPAIDVLEHDELADAAGIDALGVMRNQEEFRLLIEEVVIGLQSDDRGRPVGRCGPLVAGLEIGDLLGQE